MVLSNLNKTKKELRDLGLESLADAINNDSSEFEARAIVDFIVDYSLDILEGSNADDLASSQNLFKASLRNLGLTNENSIILDGASKDISTNRIETFIGNQEHLANLSQLIKESIDYDLYLAKSFENHSLGIKYLFSKDYQIIILYAKEPELITQSELDTLKDMIDKANEGEITPEELTEYNTYAENLKNKYRKCRTQLEDLARVYSNRVLDDEDAKKYYKLANEASVLLSIMM